MDVCIIGGSGLISTAIVDHLRDRNVNVTCYNRGRSAVRYRDPAGVEVLVGDRKDRAAFEATFADRTFDVVIDMISFTPDDARSALRALRGRCGHYVHCSTVCVTSGTPETIPTPESEPHHSIGGYGKDKGAIEDLLLAEHRDHDFPATILRPSHSYGEGGVLIRPFGAWDSFTTFPSRLRAGRKLIVPGDGVGLWASCHVDDVAAGFATVLGRPEAFGEVYHVTGSENVTWDDYHRIVAEAVGGTFEPVHIPREVLCRIARPDWCGGMNEIFAWPSIFDTSKLRALGWAGQTISWKDGAARTVAWMDAQGSTKPAEADGGYEDRLIAAWEAAVGPLEAVA
ncbi:MAG: NAD-dependent epimerase/dehydratase family protein [Armatimonadota bacterium]